MRNGYEMTAEVIDCGVDSHAIVSFVSQDVLGGGKPINSDTDSSAEPWYRFGPNNLMPQELMTLVYDNPMMPELLEKKASFVIGKGIHPTIEMKTGTEIVQDMVSDLRFSSFSKTQALDEVLGKLALNLHTLGNAALEIILSKGKKIVELNVIDFTEVRCEKLSKAGTINNYYVCGNWKAPVYDPSKTADNTVFKVPAFDPKNPTKHLKSIIHLKRYTLSNKYYGLPGWYGTRSWVKLQNQIPLWHLAGMRNGYNIRWHIQIPEAYFDQWPDKADKQKKKTEITEQLSKWLSGVENVGKSFVSFFQTDENGKAMEGWKVDPIEYNIHDEAFTVLHEQAYQAVASGGGIDPSLAGIQAPGKMGAGSGSEKRLSYQVHVILNTTSDRRALLKVMHGIEAIEGWPKEWNYAFIDQDLSTLDKLKSGVQPVLNPA